MDFLDASLVAPPLITPGGPSNNDIRNHGAAAQVVGTNGNSIIPSSLSEACRGYGGASSQTSSEPDGQQLSVVIRVRPPLQREVESSMWHPAVSVQCDTKVVLQEVVTECSAADRASGAAHIINNHAFTFDRVYNQDSSQLEVYEGAARASVSSILQGYNATIMAYGPTGTGKTYSMEGARGCVGSASDARGIIPRSMENIFQHIQESKNMASRFVVHASYLQIYNEVISDLLKPDRVNLMIREDRRRGIFIEGISEWLCRSQDEVRALMEHGTFARATAQTGANDASSRSHAVFTVTVQRSEPSSSATLGGVVSRVSEMSVGGESSRGWQPVRTGKLNLVDLAGSERPRLTGATGQRLEETKKINQSLSALGNVISALTERRPRQHIPYRDSKLTRILEDSLGGNCLTTMVAMVSPASESFSESLSTLKFASRAKTIRNSLRVNEDTSDQRALLRKCEVEVKRLRVELKESQRVQQIQHEELQRFTSFKDARPLDISAESFPHERRKQQNQTNPGDIEQPHCSQDDRLQVARYKQLLLKQREIMINLTQRLQERDEAIIGLQAEADLKDRRIADLEESIARTTTVIHFANHQPTTSSASLPPATASKCGDVPGSQLRHYPPEQTRLGADGAHGTVPLLSADEKIAELMAVLHGQRQENHNLKLHLEDVQESWNGDATPSAASVNEGHLRASQIPLNGGSAPGPSYFPTMRASTVQSSLADVCPHAILRSTEVNSCRVASLNSGGRTRSVSLQALRAADPSEHLAPWPEDARTSKARSDVGQLQSLSDQTTAIHTFPVTPSVGTSMHTQRIEAAPFEGGFVASDDMAGPRGCLVPIADVPARRCGTPAATSKSLSTASILSNLSCGNSSNGALDGLLASFGGGKVNSPVSNCVPPSRAVPPPTSIRNAESVAGCASISSQQSVAALREEAQRSVDALLAKRRAELRRTACSSERAPA